MLDPARDDHAHVAARLASEPIVWFGSTRPDGRPHHVPVWFLWDDPVVRVFASPGTQKLRNVAANPAVTLTLDSAASGADIVIVDGRAEPAGGRAADVQGFTEKYGPLLGGGSWDGWSAAFSQPVVVRVTRILAWISTPEGPRPTIVTP
jgi:PPOX class probable F420-dependent enzyme